MAISTSLVVSRLAARLSISIVPEANKLSNRGCYHFTVDAADPRTYISINNRFPFKSEESRNSTILHELGHRAHHVFCGYTQAKKSIVSELVADKISMFFFSICKVANPVAREDHYMACLVEATEEEVAEAEADVITILLSLGYTEEKIASVDF